MVLSDAQRKKLRKTAIVGGQYYNHYLLNKTFIIVTDDYQIRSVTFHKNDFNHLTGLVVNVGESAFFDLCVNGTLAFTNIKECQHYDFNTLRKKGKALKKLNCFLHAHASTNLYLINLKTHSSKIDFPAAIKNDKEDITIAFKGADLHARSLRRARNSNNFSEQHLINAIFSKDENEDLASNVVYIRNVKDVLKHTTDLENQVSQNVLNHLNKSIKAEE